MKKDLHPEYKQITITLADGSTFETRSTLDREDYESDVDSTNHPFYTGRRQFVDTAGRAYSGMRDWRQDPYFATVNVLPHVTADFPPAFLSAGNADPLLPQSEALDAAGVPVETLFFAADRTPGLGHEYQFDLDTEAGREALEALTAWLQRL